MSLFRSRDNEAKGRLAERARRAEEAPRLAAEVPELRSLHLEIEVYRSDYPLSNSKHIRRIVVDQAPALFELPCMNSFCQEGGHDLTSPILRALKHGTTRFHGEDGCNGQTGSAQCSCVLRYVAIAVFES